MPVLDCNLVNVLHTSCCIGVFLLTVIELPISFFFVQPNPDLQQQEKQHKFELTSQDYLSNLNALIMKALLL